VFGAIVMSRIFYALPACGGFLTMGGAGFLEGRPAVGQNQKSQSMPTYW